MKRLTLTTIFLLVFSSMTFPMQAGVSNCREKPLPTNDWTIFQIGFWIDIPSSTANSNVYGIKTGQVISTGIGRVFGLEASWFLAGTDNVEGLQASWLTCFNNQLDGIQASFCYNYSRDRLYGLQAGSVNISGDLCGFQPGALNLAKSLEGFQAGAVNLSDALYGLQGGVIFNKTGEMVGVQLGLLNITSEISGFQSGLINITDESDGVQLGLLNFSDNSGIQFGLLNFIKGATFPVLPFVNIKLNDDEHREKDDD